MWAGITLVRQKHTVPVFVVVDCDNMLCGVEELLAIVGPRQGAGCWVGIKTYSKV